MPEIVRRIRDLNLSIARDGDRWLVMHGDEIKHDCSSDAVAEVYLETLEEELLEHLPEVRAKRERLRQQRADADYYAMRREASARAQGKANQRGGKGGRGGV